MTITQLIAQYIDFRQATGELFQTNASILRAFCRAVGDMEVTGVGAAQVNSFLNGTGSLTSSWHVRHNALLGFYRYAISRGYVTSVPLPERLPKRPPPFVPYIYSHDELRRRLAATAAYQKNRSKLEPETLRALLLLLYGAGLRLSEALSLTVADVDLTQALLTVRDTKFYKTRLVPLGAQLTEALTRYAARRQPATCAHNDEAPFLADRTGARLNISTIEGSFQRLRVCAGIRRDDGARYQPRLHDLRHTFAVHRLTAWYRAGADVQQLLPLLSTYMGHGYLSATQVYLTMTPELLHEANLRFERYALSGSKGGGS